MKIRPMHESDAQAVLRIYQAGMDTIQSGIFPQHTASLALHQRAGFRTVGVQERVGYHPARRRWRDVVVIERRSPART